MTTFWIVVYCLSQHRCYVSQDVPGVGKDAIPRRYPTEQACLAEIHGGKEVKRNSNCFAVTDVSCINGGSVCTFTPSDEAATAVLKNMVVIPK